MSHPSFGDYRLYTWCARCQRVHRTSEWAERQWRCPAEGCGGLAEEAWRWEEVRAVDTTFPNHPIVGRCYKLHAFDWEITLTVVEDGAA